MDKGDNIEQVELSEISRVSRSKLGILRMKNTSLPQSESKPKMSSSLKIIDEYFQALGGMTYIELSASSNSTIDANVLDIFVAVSTNHYISVEVENETIVAIKGTDDIEYLSMHEEGSKYQCYMARLQEKILGGYVNNSTKIEDNPLIFSPPWSNKIIENYWNLNPIDILATKNKCIVVGDAGCGKSTLLKYITAALIKQYDNDHDVLSHETLTNHFMEYRYIPIYIELRNLFSHPDSQKIKAINKKMLSDFIQETYFNDDNEKYEKFQQAIENENILFAFDGIDEIFSKETPVAINTLTQVVEESFKAQNKKFIFSSRKNGYNGWNISDFSEIELKAMDKKCALLLAEKIMSQQRLRSIDSKISDLNKGIISNALDYEIIGNPLFMSLLVMIFINNRDSLPSRRSRIIDESIKLLINRWSAKLKSHDNYSYETATLFKCVKSMAFESLFQEEALNDSRFSDIFNRQLRIMVENFQEKESPDDSINADEIIKLLSKDTGIIVQVGDSKYRFAHRYFQEHLAASLLIEKPEYDTIIFRSLTTNSTFLQETLTLAIEIILDSGDYKKLWLLIDTLLYLYENEQTSLLPIWYIARILKARNYLLLDRADDDARYRPHDKIANYKRHLKRVIQNDEVLAPMQKLECFICYGVLGDDRKGIGLLATGIPDIKLCLITADEFIFGLSDADIEKLSCDTDTTRWSFGYDHTRELPNTKLYISSFMISKYPITVKQYNAFIRDRGYNRKEFWEWSLCAKQFFQNKSNIITELPRDCSNLPMTNITWIEAVSFCKWYQSKLPRGSIVRLPYEYEWEFAAKKQGRFFTWGDVFNKDFCNSAEYGLNCLCSVGMFDNYIDPELPSDMNGNVWEWCQSVFTDDLEPYQNSLLTSDLENIHSNTLMLTKGGSFYNEPYFLRNGFRGRDKAGEELNDNRQGFRIIVKENK